MKQSLVTSSLRGHAIAPSLRGNEMTEAISKVLSHGFAKI